MSATGTQLERTAATEGRAIAVLRQLLTELGASHGLEQLAARGPAAHLERELGLGSLERVELMLRLGDACGVRLPDRVVARAETVRDLIDAVVYEGEREPSGLASRHAEPSLISSETQAQPNPERHTGIERRIHDAESLTEILRLRGIVEPERAHIHLYEEGERLRVITFGDLHARASAVANQLRERGLEPGQTVAIMLPTCAEFFYSFAGILLAGGVPVPLYPPFRADRIA